jgi:hypothetical protein
MSDPKWTTGDELGFLRRAGLRTRGDLEDRGYGPERRHRVLDGYRAAFPNRVNWEHIDKETIRRYLDIAK